MSIFGNLFPSSTADDSGLFRSDSTHARRAGGEQGGHTASANPSAAAQREPGERKRRRGEQGRRSSTKHTADPRPDTTSRQQGVASQSVPDAAASEAAASEKEKRTKKHKRSAAGKQDAQVPAKGGSARTTTSADDHGTPDAPGARSSPESATEHSNDAEAAASPVAADAQAAPHRYTAEQLERTIFVGNVPVTGGQRQATQKLKALFKQHGDVESVRLRNVPVDTESKMPKALQIKAGKVAGARATASAYVRFAAAESVAAALGSNMALFEGAHIRVDRAAAPSRHAGAVQYEPKRSVFLGNLAFDTQEEDIIALFNTAAHEPQLEGAVEAVRLIKDGKTNVGKGIGYVLLRNRTAVLAALQLNGSECKGRKMRVMRVKASAGGANAQKVEAGRKGRGAGGGKKGATPAQRVGGNPADFAGARTKGKKKGVLKGASPAAAPAVQGAGVAKKGARVGKRPAVAARKAKQLLAAGKLSSKEATGALKKAKHQGREAKKKRSA